MSRTDEYLSRMAEVEHLLRHILRGQGVIIRALKLNTNLELNQMADFKNLVAEVTKIKGAAASTKMFVEGLQTQLSTLAAGMNDDDDQKQVEALAADLAAVSASLPQAIAANPDAGGSTGGVVG